MPQEGRAESGNKGGASNETGLVGLVTPRVLLLRGEQVPLTKCGLVTAAVQCLATDLSLRSYVQVIQQGHATPLPTIYSPLGRALSLPSKWPPSHHYDATAHVPRHAQRVTWSRLYTPKRVLHY